MYKAVAFDIDGTVVDTHFLQNAIRDAYFEQYGTAIDEEMVDTMYGSPVSAMQEILGCNDEQLAEFNRLFMKYLPKYLPMQKIYDGIRETMEALRATGCVLAINTSRTREGALEASRAMDWDFADYCDYIISCDQVKNPKPAPDSLELLAELCGCSKEEILFIGDTSFDSGCAHNAGVDFALATWGTKDHWPAAYYPEHPTDLIDIVKNHK